MSLRQAIDSFDLKDKPVIDQNIDAKGRIENLPVDLYRHRKLPRDLETSPLKPSCKDGFIDILEQARPKLTVKSNTLIDNDAGKLIDLHAYFLSPSLFPLRLCEKRKPQNPTGPSNSSTVHGRPCWLSISMKGSGSISSMLNTPSPLQMPCTIIALPIIAGTPVV